MKRPLLDFRFARGFTVLEILVALGVFVLLMVLLLQLTAGVNATTGHQLRSMEAIASSRVALDTLAQDVATLITRGGTTILYKRGDETENDALRFLCISRPAAGVAHSRFTLVTYGIEQRVDPVTGLAIPMLIRGSAPLVWPSDSEGEAADYDFRAVLRDKQPLHSDPAAERLFRFEIVWLRKDGQITRDPGGLDPDPGRNADANGFLWVDLDEVGGFVVSVAALDGQSQRRVVVGSDFSRLQQSLGTLKNSAADAGLIPAERWREELAKAEPAVARAGIRIVQRTYQLPQ